LTDVYLIRHGTYSELENESYLDDPGLSPEGVSQAERLRDRLARTGEITADTLVTSAMRRARETAEILAPALGAPVVVDRDLEEWRGDDGSLEPGEFTARWREIPEAQRPFVRVVPGCESWLEFSARVQLALNRVIQEHEGKTIAIVSHGGVIQAAFLYFFGIGTASIPGVSIENTSITHWAKPDPTLKWVLMRYNDHQHLQPPA
jgi:probable phosphoglycerate mutase